MLDGTTGKSCQKDKKKKRPNGNSTPFCKSIDSTTPQTRGLAPQSPQLCPKNAKRDPSRPPATTTATTIPPKKHKKTNNRGVKKNKNQTRNAPFTMARSLVFFYYSYN